MPKDTLPRMLLSERESNIDSMLIGSDRNLIPKSMLNVVKISSTVGESLAKLEYIAELGTSFAPGYEVDEIRSINKINIDGQNIYVLVMDDGTKIKVFESRDGLRYKAQGGPPS